MINYDSPRGGVSVITEKGEVTTSYLLVQHAQPADSGQYTCHPSNANTKTILVHVLNGMYIYLRKKKKKIEVLISFDNRNHFDLYSLIFFSFLRFQIIISDKLIFIFGFCKKKKKGDTFFRFNRLFTPFATNDIHTSKFCQYILIIMNTDIYL